MQLLLGLIIGSTITAAIFIFREKKLVNELIQNHQKEIVQKDYEITQLNNSLIAINKKILLSQKKHKTDKIDLSFLDNLPSQFINLKQFLANKEWQKADEETARIMLSISQTKSSYLSVTEIRNFPLKDLILIDKLWTYYSQNYFGFSVQREIYLKLNQKNTFTQETWRKVGHVLGWYVNKQWLGNYEKLIFSKEAPRGQFPFLPIWKGVFWGGFIDSQGDRFVAIISRMADC